MNAFVIDVNVLITANARETEQASPECVLNCIDALEMVRGNVVVLDDSDLIFEDYQKYNSFRGQPGLGDAFFKWLHDNRYSSNHFEFVIVTPIHANEEIVTFENVPLELGGFDRKDHIWLAVARASRYSPTILNATDKDWKEWQERIESNGFVIKFLCPELMGV